MISKIFDPILNIFRFHKKKLLVFSWLYLFFLYLFFPFNDLGDFVAQKVSDLSGGQVFVNFDNLSLSLFPQPGLSLSNVVVETAFTPKLTAKELSLAPSIAGLLSFKPGISAHAEKLLGGDLSVSTRGGDKTQTTKKTKQKVDVELSSLDLSKIAELAQLPLRIAGSLSGSVTAQVDLDFSEQPAGDIAFQIAKGLINDSQINTAFGPISLPRTSLNDVVIEGHLEKGACDISKFVIGKPGGDLYANMTGKIDIRFDKVGPSTEPRMGGYDLTVKLQVGEALKQKMGAFLGIIQSYQNAPNSYSFRISAASTMVPPSLTRAQ